MQSLQQQLTDIVARACTAAGIESRFGQVVRSDRPDLAQFQCNGALAAAKELGKNPRDIAQSLIDILIQDTRFRAVSIAGPGFVNLVLADDWLAEYIQTYAHDERLGVTSVDHPEKITIDFGGLNVAKPMHVGHLRSLVIGESLQRLLKFMGHTVMSDTHLGDWGTQMGMVIVELNDRHPDWPYFDESFTGPYPTESPVTIEYLAEVYPASSKKAKEDLNHLQRAQVATMELQNGRIGYRALWEHIMLVSLELLKKEVAFLGVSFDVWNGEAHYHERIPKMLARMEQSGHVQESDGALIVPLGEEMPPCLLRKADGAYLYSTTDLAAIDERVTDLAQDRLLYVVDLRQSLHFKQVFAAARVTGIAPDTTQMVHVGFGTVNGTDGKPFKTRSGESVQLGSLMQDAIQAARKKMEENHVATEYPENEKEEIARLVGLSALKFSDLSTTRTQEYIFDINRMVQFEGKTGPYVLYTLVRLQSILKKAHEQGIEAGAFVSATDGDRSLLLALARFPEVMNATVAEYMPHILAEYVYDLAQECNQFYNSCQILKEENSAQQAAWLSLTSLAARQLELSLSLLGIEAPERM